MELEQALLRALHEQGVVENSEAFASSQGVDHNVVVGVIKSLEAHEMIVAEVRGQRRRRIYRVHRRLSRRMARRRTWRTPATS